MVRNLIKSFWEIQEDSICLLAGVEVRSKVMNSEDKLNFGGTSLSEAMLIFGENTVIFQISDDRAMDDIYTQTKVKQQLTCFKHKKMFRTKILEI